MSSGSPVRFYIDGNPAQTSSAALLDAVPAPVGAVWGVALGRIAAGTPDPGAYLHGHVDEVRVGRARERKHKSAATWSESVGTSHARTPRCSSASASTRARSLTASRTRRSRTCKPTAAPRAPST
eukprot:1401824-Rhodomonas_salina.1